MNIHGYKIKLKKARDMLNNTKQELIYEKRKRGIKRDYDEIERLNNLIKNIKLGQSNLRNKIKKLKQGGKKKK